MVGGGGITGSEHSLPKKKKNNNNDTGNMYLNEREDWYDPTYSVDFCAAAQQYGFAFVADTTGHRFLFEGLFERLLFFFLFFFYFFFYFFLFFFIF